MCELLVDICGISKSYTARKILNEITFTIHKGDFISIQGCSGAGKSTLINIMAGFETPDSGQVKIDSKSIGECLKQGVMARDVGFVFQAYNLLSGRTVKDNIMLPTMYALDMNCFDNYDLIVNQLKLKSLEYNLIDTLSGGEKQRVAIARAMILSPKIILADEPTGNLDSDNADNIMQTFSEINKCYHVAIVVITHDALIAKYASKHFLLENGNLKEIF
jgi:ABC-type lipoprotein export system ATPase subunit